YTVDIPFLENSRGVNGVFVGGQTFAFLDDGLGGHTLLTQRICHDLGLADRALQCRTRYDDNWCTVGMVELGGSIHSGHRRRSVIRFEPVRSITGSTASKHDNGLSLREGVRWVVGVELFQMSARP